MASAPRTRAPTPAELVERIRGDLAAAEVRLAQCERARVQFAELSVTDPAATKDYAEATRDVDLVRGEIGRLKLALAGAEGKARQVEAERIARDQAAHVARVEALLAKRDQILGVELAETLAKAERLFREGIALSERVAAGWPFSGQDQIVALLVANPIVRAVQLEIWRVGSRPFIGGNSLAKAEPSFPGGRCDDHRLRAQPDKLPTLASVLANATGYAVAIMKGQRPSTAPLAIGSQVEQRILSAPEIKLGELLREQARLADDVTAEGEKKYAAVVAEIATVQAEIDASKGATAA
jgi:hypothetical protein